MVPAITCRDCTLWLVLCRTCTVASFRQKLHCSCTSLPSQMSFAFELISCTQVCKLPLTCFKVYFFRMSIDTLGHDRSPKPLFSMFVNIIASITLGSQFRFVRFCSFKMGKYGLSLSANPW